MEQLETRDLSWKGRIDEDDEKEGLGSGEGENESGKWVLVRVRVRVGRGIEGDIEWQSLSVRARSVG